jgi:hypothetical protein
MKRYLKLLVVFLLVCPIFIRAAECDYNRHTEYMKYANYITYETEYSLGDNKFTVKFYNVIKGFTLKIGTVRYTPDENDMVTISEINEGKVLDVYIYGNDGCSSQAGNLSITLPYYNPYYKTQICKGYEQLNLCASQFTTTKATKEIIEKTKANYDNIIIQRTDPEEEKPAIISFINKAKDIFVNYILKVLLALGSAALTIVYYNNKLIKVEHGV